MKKQRLYIYKNVTEYGSLLQLMMAALCNSDISQEQSD